MSETSEFIRRSDAIEELKKWADGYKYIEQPTDNAIERFEQIPEGIVRCKDCKHYYYADNRIPQEQRFVCDLDGDRWKPDSFCSYAERRTDE